MVTTLTSPPVSTLLERLFAVADGDDARLASLVNEHPDLAADGSWDARSRLLDDVAIPVSPEAGRLLYALVRATRPTTIVEYGMSFAISTLHLAAAVRDNGVGHVVTTEQSEAKAGRARRHLDEAGLADVVTILEGDARQTLTGLDRPVDLLLLDGWPTLAHDVLRILEPRISSGALVLTDDTDQFPDELRTHLAYLRDPANGYTSVAFPVADGMEISCRS